MSPFAGSSCPRPAHGPLCPLAPFPRLQTHGRVARPTVSPRPRPSPSLSLAPGPSSGLLTVLPGDLPGPGSEAEFCLWASLAARLGIHTCRPSTAQRLDSPGARHLLQAAVILLSSISSPLPASVHYAPSGLHFLGPHPPCGPQVPARWTLPAPPGSRRSHPGQREPRRVFTRGRGAATSSLGQGLGMGAGPPAGLDALSTRVPLCGSEPQTAASRPAQPRPHPTCLPHPHPPLGGLPGLQGPGGRGWPWHLPALLLSPLAGSILDPQTRRVPCAWPAPLPVLAGGRHPPAELQVSPASLLSPPVFSPEPDPACGQGTSQGTAHEQLGFHLSE